MPLHSQAERLLKQLAQANVKPFHQLTPREARDQMLLGSQFLAAPEPVHAVEDREVPGAAGPLPVRIYRPGSAGPLPALVYLHGGGWLMGSIQTHDSYCRNLCRRAEIVVVSVDYRLAPEHKFPAAVEDAHAAARWVESSAAELAVRPDRIGVGGDSAGGNLAAAVALLARERGGPALCFQLLIYPVLDFRFDTRSYHENGSGFHLTRQDMIWSWRQYLRTEFDGDSPLASPLRAGDLQGLPGGLVITAEYDPLRDEGESYARRLAEAGVPVICKRYDGMIHGFARRMNQFDVAREALEDIAAALRAALHAT
jgi:acetyl esterase